MRLGNLGHYNNRHKMSVEKPAATCMRGPKQKFTFYKVENLLSYGISEFKTSSSFLGD